MRIVHIGRTTLLLPDTASEWIGLRIACLLGALKSHRTMFSWCARADDAQEPGGKLLIAFGVRNDQGFWVGCWSDRKCAEIVLGKGQPSHGEHIVTLYGETPLK